MMKRRTHGDHQLQAIGDGSQRGRRRPGVETRLVDTFDVVQIQFGEEADVVSDLLAADGQIAHVTPTRLHPLVADVAQPPAEHREPISESEAHDALSARAMSASTRRAVGSKPTTETGSATKLESALMS